MGDARGKFIKPLMAVVSAPKTDDLVGYVKAYEDVLNEFDDDVLQMAAADTIRTLKYKSMPLPGECLEACRQAFMTLQRRKLKRSKPKIREQFMWTQEMAEKADRLFVSHWGKRACEDGVEIGMWDFLVRHQQWPNEMEYQRMKSNSLAVQDETRRRDKELRDRGEKLSDLMGFKATLKSKSDKLNRMVEHVSLRD